jgi:hypothetical protein
MEIILILLGVLGLVTLVGHGIWVALAALVRALAGNEPSEPTTAAELTDLDATARQLAAFQKAGALDAETCQRLQDCIVARRRILTEPPSVPHRSPAPAAEHVKPLLSPAEKPVLQRPQVRAEEEVLEALPVQAETKSEPARVIAAARAPAPPPRVPAPPRAEPKPPKPPRRSLAEVLAAFMEERNIFWGELVGGLLMVGCSIALVIYLWKDLERIPYFQFLILVGTTAALFGAGLYALHRLKLQTTSRGLLVIATLLVPLNFLVMAGLAGQEADAGLLRTSFRIGTEAVSLAVFALLLGSAARALAPDRHWPLLLAVLGASTSQLAVPRLLEQGQTDLWPFLLLATLPVASYGVSAAGALHHFWRRSLNQQQAYVLLAFLGLSLFPLAVALGFLAYWTGDLGLGLERLALPVAVAGVPVLAGGLLIHRGMAEVADRAARAPAGGAVRTAGTVAALAGMLVLLGAVILAWPQPLALLLVCALDFAVLTLVALVFRLPLAHGPALACLAVGYLTALHFFLGHLAVPREDLAKHMIDLLISAQSGSALVLLVVLLGTAAALFIRAGQSFHAVFYSAGSAIAALVSLAVVNLHGVEEPGSAVLVTAIYAIGCLVLSAYWRPSISYLGLALAVVTTLWALWWGERAVTPLWGMLLAIESLVMAATAVWILGTPRSESVRGRLANVLLPAAWRDLAALTGSLALTLVGWGILDAPADRLHTWTGMALAATALLLAWTYQAPAVTWLGSALILGSIFHGIFIDARLTYPAPDALLAHATAVLLGGILLKQRGARSSELSATSTSRIFAEPLWQSALVSSSAALPVMHVAAWGEMVPLTALMGWLSALWLVMAWAGRRPLLFAAFQAALTGTVLFGVAASLESRAWGGYFPNGLADPHNWYAYGIGLSMLSLLWVLLRLALRSNELAQRMLEPRWPAVDRAVLGVLVLGQLILAIWSVLPGTALELSAGGIRSIEPLANVGTYHPAAWPLVAILALALGLGLWDKRPADALLGLVILAVTVPILAAEPSMSQFATASALRWGLAIGFLVTSMPLIAYPHRSAVRQARRMLVGGCIIPVLLLTGVSAAGFFTGQLSDGPAPSSIFAGFGIPLSQAAPLIIISLGLVAHALREHSPGYAFSAGMMVNMAVMLGYTLHLVSGGQPFGEAEWVRLFQLGTITAALWALAWLLFRPWVHTWRDGEVSRLAGPLMSAQLNLGAAGNALLVLTGVWLLASFFPARLPWTAEVGSPLGWLALVLATVAAAERARQGHSHLQPHTVGSLGMAGVGLLACTVAGRWPEWGYRTLMVGWAGYAPALVAAAWVREWQSGRVTTLDTEDADLSSRLRALGLQLSQSLTAATAAFWVRVAGILVIALGVKAAVAHQDHWWAAGAIAVASSAGAAMAVWRRREDWAFSFGLGVNLAASLVVWHFNSQDPLANWWIYLLQANVIAAAVVALLWLGTRKQLSGTLELSIARGPLLAIQIALGLSGNAVLLLGPLGWLFANPGKPLTVDLLLAGQIWGWLALCLGVAAAFWYADQVAPRGRGHVLCTFGMAVGTLAACSASQWAQPGDWLAYHVLIAAWTGTGLIILAAESVAKLRGGELEEFSPFPRLAQLFRFSMPQFQRWLDGVGLSVLALAVRGTWSDPSRPFWSAGATLAVSAMAGAVALRSQLPAYVYLSGLLANLAGVMIWVAWGPPSALSFGYAQALCLGLASACWSALELGLQSRTPTLNLRGRLPAFAHLAAVLSLGILGFIVAVCVGSDVAEGGLEAVGALPWAALGATAVALVLLLWDRSALFAIGGLYVLGLAAIGMTLHTFNLDPKSLGWFAALAMAGYVLLTALVGWAAPQAKEFWRAVGLPDRRLSWPEAWFPVAQSAVALVVAGLSVWMSLAFPEPLQRLAGTLTVVLLVAAGVLLAHTARGRWATDLRYATLVVGLVAVAEASWALLDPAQNGLWLHRSILLMTALALMTWLYGAGLPRILGQPNEWAACGRRISPVLDVLAFVMLMAVLIQEGLLYDKDAGRTPMHPLATGVVMAALVGMIAAGIYFAIAPGRDPFGLSDRGRKFYVYAGEVLLALLFVHTWLTMPELFGGKLAQYWTLIVMAIAFVGVGLSELFKRRRLLVLAEPLQRTSIFLPLLPLLAFWVGPSAPLHEWADQHVHALLPMSTYFEWLDPNYGKYALLWFLLGLLYTLVAVTNRSARFALGAALAGNFGLWALLFHHNLTFLVHPQMWLVPSALIVLAAEHHNRDRISEPESNALRYLALLAIYVSSTADLFIAGLGTSVILPVVLAVLSISGVLAGILLRVRAFLYLGVTFLFVVIFTMIWHAAVGQHQIWVWWASGIVLGAAIIALFAVFEKRRNDVLRVLEQLKKWD